MPDVIKMRESKMAHTYLDGLRGIEIGASAPNPFGLRNWNIDFSGDMDNFFKTEEVRMCGEAAAVDVEAFADSLPLRDNCVDFVLTSHVVEHMFDPIRAIGEWYRVTKPGGLVFLIVPHKERTFDKDRPRTPLQELLDRHSGVIPPPEIDNHRHHSVWITQDFLELCLHLDLAVADVLDIDDKIGNGFTVVVRKPGVLEAQPRVTVGPFGFAMAAALAHHQAGNVAQAELQYRQVLTMAPHFPDALHQLGLAAWQQGRADEGMDLVQKAITINPSASHYHLNLAKMAQVRGRWQEALLGFRLAAALDPNSVDAHFYAGLLAGQSGQIAGALASYERVMSLLRPDFATAFSKRDDALARADDRVVADAA